LAPFKLEGLTPFFAPEKPRLKVNLAIATNFTFKVIDNEVEGVIHMVLAPKNREVTPITCNISLVGARDGILRRCTCQWIIWYFFWYR
jgi:hypothetical protein